MLTVFQRRLLITSVTLMLVLAIETMPLTRISASDVKFAIDTISIAGPVTIPLVLVITMALINTLKLAYCMSDDIQEHLVKRIKFHVDNGLSLGILGTFLGMAMSHELGGEATFHAMFSSIAAMSASLLITLLVDKLTHGRYSLKGGSHV